jgi:hypothetical protein
MGAVASLLANARRLAFRYLWKWLWAILLAVAAVGVSIWAALTYAPAGTLRAAAVLVSAAGFLGVSWAGIRATWEGRCGKPRNAMWQAEVVAAIGRAATIIPKHNTTSQNSPKVTDQSPEADPAAL